MMPPSPERRHSQTMRLRTTIDVAVPLITVVLMTVVGTDLRLADFGRLLRRSRSMWSGLLVPPVVLPPLALGLIAMMGPPPPIAMGLLLIATCPVGGISNTFSYLARASTALSVALTTLSCLLATATMPVVSAMLALATPSLPIARLPVPALLTQLVAAMALPITVGMTARSRLPGPTARLAPVMWRVAVVLLGALLALIILADVHAFVAALPHAVPLAAMFVACSFLVGAGVGKVIGADRRERATLAIEFATRNVAVATMVAVTVLGRVEFATFATAYFLTELPLMTETATVLRRVLASEGGAPVEDVHA
jgi:BASS family bile acid:Na+ symporter